jgi:hypothetical protein
VLHTNWSRVAKGLSKISFDPVLRLKIKLLEQLWRDGDALGGMDVVHLFAIASRLAVDTVTGRHIEVGI